MAIEGTTGRRVWLKAFWGFDPSNEGYLGFTAERDRARLLDMYAPGDLVLIYGADTNETAKLQRKQALGFLEIEAREIRDVEAISEFGLARKKRLGTTGRWTFALPVLRAWEVQRRIDVKAVANITYDPDMGRVIAKRGELLTSEEARRALELPVRPVSVFGQPPIDPWDRDETLVVKLRPSRGITPSFGTREVTVEDGDHYLYLMIADGDASAVLGRSRNEMHDKTLVKVGYSSNPDRRRGELNSGLPPSAVFKWRLDLKSKVYASGLDAIRAEENLKSLMNSAHESLGGEFFLGKLDDLRASFYSVRDVGFHIRGATIKSKSVR